MIGVGVGGADAVDVMAGFEWELPMPKVKGIHLTGHLQGWTSPKDIILHVANKLKTTGGTGCLLEYFGDGVETLSATGMATICNMGAEVGATSSVFPYTTAMHRYLEATGRGAIASAADRVADALLRPDPHARYDEVLEIDLSVLTPYLTGPHTPAAGHPIATMAALCDEMKYPHELSVGLIGSCTNSSYEDITRAASVLRDARAHGIVRTRAPLFLSPGSERIRAQMERDGLLRLFVEAGATVLANACGPCIGMWNRQDKAKSEPNCIATTFNRNFPKRNDGSAKTLAFVGSPEVVTALAIAGRVSFDPSRDAVSLPGHEPFHLAPPHGIELPERGFAVGVGALYQPPLPPAARGAVAIRISATSPRLQFLTPFAPRPAGDVTNALILAKAQSPCTTDTISPAGVWLDYRGHLERIAQNLLSVATSPDSKVEAGVNALTKSKVNLIRNRLTGQFVEAWQAALSYREAGRPWVIVGDVNYGEGSSREHAALEPRLLGCAAVICRSFARIHEGNLKKQAVLALTFVHPDDHAHVHGDDVVSLVGVSSLAPGSRVILHVEHHAHDPTLPPEDIPLAHTLNETQIGWYRAGSALNLIAAAQEAAAAAAHH